MRLEEQTRRVIRGAVLIAVTSTVTTGFASDWDVRPVVEWLGASLVGGPG